MIFLKHPLEIKSFAIVNTCVLKSALFKPQRTALFWLSYATAIHHKIIWLLGIELYKVKNNLSVHLMSEIFNLRNIDYNLHSQTDFKQGPVNTVNYGLKSLRYLAPKIWNIIPLEIRNSGSLTEFITNIKSWIPKHCPCTLCRIYIHHVGYID